jgi:ribosomal protein S18 acetylase RimI-like enzyme
MEIREFDLLLDRPGVRACFVELQDFERGLDPRMPPGDAIADRYLELMFRRCDEFDGTVLVAHASSTVIGFVTVYARHRSGEPDDDPAPHGFVSDLVVAAAHRKRGIGRALLRAAEARARGAGVGSLLLAVKAGNAAAAALYAAEGFEPTELLLEKRLR